jgi:hypothetical protein
MHNYETDCTASAINFNTDDADDVITTIDVLRVSFDVTVKKLFLGLAVLNSIKKRIGQKQ